MSAAEIFTEIGIYGGSALLTLSAYELAKRVVKFRPLNKAPLLIVAGFFILAALEFLPLGYADYTRGSYPFMYLLGPATVALAYPLYRHWALVVENRAAVLAAALVGCISSVSSVWIFAALFGLDSAISISLTPKSVTTPVALEISRQLEGIPAITLCAVFITGIGGAAVGHGLLKIFCVKNDASIGLAMGATSHVIGTAKCLEKSQSQAAFGALVIVLSGLVTAVLAPVLAFFVF